MSDDQGDTTTVTCASCDASFEIGVQTDEDLKAGVVWECSTCGERNLLKSEPSTPPPDPQDQDITAGDAGAAEDTGG